MRKYKLAVPMMVCREVLVACDCDTVKAEQLLRDQGWGGTCCIEAAVKVHLEAQRTVLYSRAFDLVAEDMPTAVEWLTSEVVTVLGIAERKVSPEEWSGESSPYPYRPDPHGLLHSAEACPYDRAGHCPVHRFIPDVPECVICAQPSVSEREGRPVCVEHQNGSMR